ncbi:NEL-type E3 ubiquitin ligase domain-containing protein [Actimicrobium sp. CCC2.4]|uniref:NEL-type E3 ubiquitin ligase domain-containing protein n=1 Tax=Actimicrobium sp. CCC2.4 TaxID=3048606 RepID=UPI002AC98EEA|nr:NEL-type E3 ubiquitin ligase domain-containing protein [Actimicrobium sp. CCC2.4]MEB0134590.1 NEL-type E3 ubiquitin ligase domain-containing protein [Actimicrobium sp. CCC2.4]WPX34032.1 NEL-type E3 ubiquitin ligase domain-containing protein [Actimicrobium sp. CCC2.4]
MMKRISNLLRRKSPRHVDAEPVVAAADAAPVNAMNAARPRERNRNAALIAFAAEQGHPLAEARQRAAHNPAPVPAAVVAPEPEVQPPEPFDLKLQDLRLHRHETDQNLVFAYPVPEGVFEPVALAVDPASAGIEGRAYLQFLLTDPRTEGEMIGLIEEKYLPPDHELSEERLNDIATRLRAVMAESYLSDDLMGEINVLAVEGLAHCKDRADVALGQMEDAALHARLIRGGVTDETTLYNYGVSFYMSNAVTEETRRLLAERHAVGEIPRQEVHDIQNAHFHLQETLHLPHRLQEPIVPYARGGIVTQRLAEDIILPRVTARALEHNGQNVMQFISNWAPWRKHLNENWPPMQKMTASFHRRSEKAMEDRDVPGHRINRMNEVEYEALSKQVQTDRLRVETELADQLALELLFNRRGEYLVEHNGLSSYFG